MLSASISNPFVYLVPLFFYRDNLFWLARPLNLFEFLKIINSQTVSAPSEAAWSAWHAECYTAVNNKRNSFELFWHFTIKWNANGWPLGNSTLFPNRVQMLNKGTMVGAARPNRISAIKICANNNDPLLEFKTSKWINNIASMFTRIYMAG